MHRTLSPVLVLTLLACGNAEEEEELPPPDPDVNTFIPSWNGPAEPVRLVHLGDSISAGVGSSRDALAYTALLQENADGRWPEHVDVDLATLHPSITEVIDVSEPGETTATMLRNGLPALERELGQLPASGETIVVFTIGGNDAQGALLPGSDAGAVIDTTLANMEELVTELQAMFADEVWIYATNVYEPSDAVGQSECFFGYNYGSILPELDRYNSALTDLGAELGFSAVDLRGHFLGHGFRNRDDGSPHYDAEDPTRWLADDCIHPNDRGHHEIRRLFHAAISGEPLRVEPELDEVTE